MELRSPRQTLQGERSLDIDIYLQQINTKKKVWRIASNELDSTI